MDALAFVLNFLYHKIFRRQHAFLAHLVAHGRQNGFAGLRRCQGRGIDQGGADWDHQGRLGSLAVLPVPSFQIFPNAVGFSSFGTFAYGGVQIKLVVRFGKDIASDISSFHDEGAELKAFSLFSLHPLAGLGGGRNSRH